jgi:hypothetical protein
VGALRKRALGVGVVDGGVGIVGLEVVGEDDALDPLDGLVAVHAGDDDAGRPPVSRWDELAVHLVGQDRGDLPRRGLEDLGQGQRGLERRPAFGVIALIDDAADIGFGLGHPDDFAQGDAFPETGVEWIVAKGADAGVEEADGVALGQFHQALPVQGVSLCPCERLLDDACALRVGDDFERPGFGNETDLAELLRRELEDARAAFVGDL